MEPNSKVYGVTEECHSSESGWTMYIGSPFYGDDDDNDHAFDNDAADIDDNGDSKGKGYSREDEDDSDDSMASDASSGPSHQGNGSLKHKVNWKKQGNGGESESESVEASKPIMESQIVNGEKKLKKKNVVLMDGGIRGDTGNNLLYANQSRSIKVRKNFLFGKRH